MRTDEKYHGLWALTLDEDGRIIGESWDKFAHPNLPRVKELPPDRGVGATIDDYLYINGEYVWSPLNRYDEIRGLYERGWYPDEYVSYCCYFRRWLTPEQCDEILALKTWDANKWYQTTVQLYKNGAYFDDAIRRMVDSKHITPRQCGEILSLRKNKITPPYEQIDEPDEQADKPDEQPLQPSQDISEAKIEEQIYSYGRNKTKEQFELIKGYFAKGLIKQTRIEMAVRKGWITQEECDEILNQKE